MTARIPTEQQLREQLAAALAHVDLLRRLVEDVRDANSEASGDTFRLLTGRQEYAWRALLAVLEGPNVGGDPDHFRGITKMVSPRQPDSKEQEVQGKNLPYGDAYPGERGNTRAPQFGEWLRGVWASEDNPTRDGMYVRTVRRTGRVTNPGTWYELTDGKGKFWQYLAKDTVFVMPDGPVEQPVRPCGYAELAAERERCRNKAADIASACATMYRSEAEASVCRHIAYEIGRDPL